MNSDNISGDNIRSSLINNGFYFMKVGIIHNHHHYIIYGMEIQIM